ncbi:MAG TPA: hypothetical protein VLS49_11770 [Usitatibacter sp.]|nr:hypothetical protein [Usitatibacter sp.]
MPHEYDFEMVKRAYREMARRDREQRGSRDSGEPGPRNPPAPGTDPNTLAEIDAR